MLFFQEPPLTRYDLRFNLAGIPVRVHPLFWLVTLLFGASFGNLPALLVWVVAVFVSLLVHELGHALAMRFYGRPSRIVLYFGGGLTVPESTSWGYQRVDVSLTANQEIVVSLAGPGAGFLLAGLVLAGGIAAGGSMTIVLLFGLLPFPFFSFPAGMGFLNLIVESLLWVNIFWGLVNLVPVFPLDGGQVARMVWIQTDPWDGVRKSLRLSVVAGAVVALAGLILMQSIFIAILFGLLAFQSYQALQGRSVL